jgi:uncharacterized protein (TIGR02145 family)
MAVVTIGGQSWVVENLDVDTFRDGTSIAHASSSAQWDSYAKSLTPAWCYYKFDSSNSRDYGRLYNWYAVSASQNLAPVGFRLPTLADWTTLINAQGGQLTAGRPLKNTKFWGSMARINGNGSNASGFTANPGGYMLQDGEFYDFSWSANFWSTTTASAGDAYTTRLFWQNAQAINPQANMGMGLSVRILASGSYTGSSNFNPSENYG